VKDDRLYLHHILECIGFVGEFTKEGKEFFFADRKTQDAVVRNLQILAESTTRLSDHLKAPHSSVDWHAISAFRNVVVHDYLGVDLQQVWRIVENSLPVLKRTVEAILRELGNSP
jgi:uncharacterized protein with HEPN domain